MPLSNRRACDRCHTQKLRCPRTGWDNEDSCSRCLHAGAHCVYSAPLPTGRPSNARGKKAAARAQAATAANTAPVSTGSEPFVDSVAWTSPNIESLLHSALNMDTSTSWNSYPSDLASPFSTGSFDEATNKGGLGGSSISSLSPPPRSSTHSSKISNDSWDDLPFIAWPDQPNIDATEACIRQLSDLNVRLYPVYKISSQFVGGQKMDSGGRPGIKFSSNCFETATSFLQGEDSLFQAAQNQSRSALSEIFRAPGILIDILQRFSNSFPAKQRIPSDSSMSKAMDTASEEELGLMTPLSPTSSASSVSPFKIQSASESPGEEIKCHEDPQSTGEMSPDSATHHLVLACYIRLLRIYHTLIVALQGDASELKDLSLGAPSLNAELRLFILVQLITQLLERLRKAVAAYFCILPDKPDEGGLVARTSSTDVLGAPEVDLVRVKGLEGSIQEDLKQLQMILHT